MATKTNDGTASKLHEKKGKAAEADNLSPCDKPHVAEASRNEDSDEACDDGVR